MCLRLFLSSSKPLNEKWPFLVLSDLTNTFICFQKSADVDTRIEQIRNANVKKGSTVQPFLLLVGNAPSEKFIEYFVVLNDFKYKVPSAIDALNLIFQLFFAVDISYPQISCHIWQVVQVVCYDFYEPEQVLKTAQKVLISDLKC